MIVDNIEVQYLVNDKIFGKYAVFREIKQKYLNIEFKWYNVGG